MNQQTTDRSKETHFILDKIGCPLLYMLLEHVFQRNYDHLTFM